MAYVSTRSYPQGGDSGIMALVLGNSGMSGLEGLDGLEGVIAGVSGLGTPPSPAGYANFNDFQNAVIASFPPCPPPNDPSCENPRDAAIAAALAAWTSDPTSCRNVVCNPSGSPRVQYASYTNPATGQATAGLVINTTSGPIPVTPQQAVIASPAPRPAGSPTSAAVLPAGTQPVQVGAPAPAYSPRLSFITSRGGTALQPGDTWTVQIQGAPPNSPVTVTGGNMGQSITNSMGATDANGNFSLSGSITSDQAGVWAEQWSVGGQPAGSFAFTVTVPPGPQPGSTSIPAQPAGAPQTGVPQDTGGTSIFSQPVSIGGYQIPTWAFIVAAGGAALLLLGEARQ